MMDVELAVDDRIADNDPRMTGRVLTVSRIDGHWVFARDSRGRLHRIKQDRIYTDARARRSGFSLTKDPTP